MVAGDHAVGAAQVALHAGELADGGGEIALRLGQVGLHAAHVGLHVGDVAGDSGHLLRGLLLGAFQPLGVSLFAPDDVLGAHIHLLLRQAQRFSQLVGGNLQAGVGLAQFRCQFLVLLLGDQPGTFVWLAILPLMV